MEKRASAAGVLFALTAGVAWGFTGTVGQFLFSEKGLDAGWLTVVRMATAGVILLAIAALRQKGELIRIWRAPKDGARLVLFALCGLMAVQYSYMAAIEASNSATATALQYVGQAFILLYVCAAGRRLPRAREAAALGAAMVGIFLLATHGKPGSLALSPRALVWGGLAALSLAVYTLLPAPLIRQYGSACVTGYGMLIGGVALFFITRWWTISASLDSSAALGIAAVVLIGTVGGFSLYLKAVSLIGGVRAGLLSLTEMLSAPLFSALWLGTKFVAADWAGFCLMVAMVFLMAKKSE